MPKITTSKLVYTGLFAALCCVATMMIQIPSPMTGYLNLGDGVVLLSGFLLGPIYGMLAGGIGSMLADLLSGYAHYAPATLVIKGAASLVAGLLLRRLAFEHRSTGRHIIATILAGICGELLMVAGYFAYAFFALGNGVAALATIPGNLIQGGLGVFTAAMLLSALHNVPAIRHFYQHDTKTS